MIGSAHFNPQNLVNPRIVFHTMGKCTIARFNLDTCLHDNLNWFKTNLCIESFDGVLFHYKNNVVDPQKKLSEYNFELGNRDNDITMTPKTNLDMHDDLGDSASQVKANDITMSDIGTTVSSNKSGLSNATEKSNAEIEAELRDMLDSDDDDAQLSESEFQRYTSLDKVAQKQIAKGKTIESHKYFVKNPNLFRQYQELKRRYDEHGAEGETKLPIENTGSASASTDFIEQRKIENIKARQDKINGVIVPTTTPNVPARHIEIDGMESQAIDDDDDDVINMNILSAPDLINFLMEYYSSENEWHKRHLFRFWVDCLNEGIEPLVSGVKKKYLTDGWYKCMQIAFSDEDIYDDDGTKLLGVENSINYVLKAKNKDHPIKMRQLRNLSKNFLENHLKKDLKWFNQQIQLQIKFNAAVDGLMAASGGVLTAYEELITHGDKVIEPKEQKTQTPKQAKASKQKHLNAINEKSNSYFKGLNVGQPVSESEECDDGGVKLSSSQVTTLMKTLSPTVDKKRKAVAVASKGKSKQRNTPKRTSKTKANQKISRQSDLETFFGKSKAQKALGFLYEDCGNHMELTAEILRYGREYYEWLDNSKKSKTTITNYKNAYAKFFQDHYNSIDGVSSLWNEKWVKKNLKAVSGTHHMAKNFIRFYKETYDE